MFDIEDLLWLICGVGIMLVPIGLLVWIWVGFVGAKILASGLIIAIAFSNLANII